MLKAAVDDGILLVNPADKLGRKLRLAPSKEARQEDRRSPERSLMRFSPQPSGSTAASIRSSSASLARACGLVRDSLSSGMTSTSHAARPALPAHAPKTAPSAHRSRGTTAQWNSRVSSSRRSGTWKAHARPRSYAGCDKATWRLISPNGVHLAIWPDEETVGQLPANAYPELRDKAAEHIAMVADMRQKLRDLKASRFTLAELDCLWGEYKAEDVETRTVVTSRVIHEAFGRKWMARLRREA